MASGVHCRVLSLKTSRYADKTHTWCKVWAVLILVTSVDALERERKGTSSMCNLSKHGGSWSKTLNQTLLSNIL